MKVWVVYKVYEYENFDCSDMNIYKTKESAIKAGNKLVEDSKKNGYEIINEDCFTNDGQTVRVSNEEGEMDICVEEMMVSE